MPRLELHGTSRPSGQSFSSDTFSSDTFSSDSRLRISFSAIIPKTQNSFSYEAVPVLIVAGYREI